MKKQVKRIMDRQTGRCLSAVEEVQPDIRKIAKYHIKQHFRWMAEDIENSLNDSLRGRDDSDIEEFED